MKTISKREGKNYEIEVKGDLHKYPDGSVHTVKEGKAVREEGESGGGGSGGGVLMVTDTGGTLDKTMGEIQDAYLAGKRVIINYGVVAGAVVAIVPVGPGKNGYTGQVTIYVNSIVSSSVVLVPRVYTVYGETEEATRNAYPALPESLLQSH